MSTFELEVKQKLTSGSDVPNAERLGEFLMAVLEWVEGISPSPNLTPNPSPKGEGKAAVAL